MRLLNTSLWELGARVRMKRDFDKPVVHTVMPAPAPSTVCVCVLRSALQLAVGLSMGAPY